MIFSDWFGTQSGADVLVAVKGAAASVVLQGLDAAGIEATVMARFSAYLPERAAKVVLKSVA